MLINQCRAADQLRKDLGPTLDDSQGPKQTLNREQLRNILDVAMRMAAENAITEDNAFALEFIDVLPSLVFNEKSTVSLEEGGLALDVGTRIYSKRVDNMHKEANHTLMDMTRKKKDGGERGAYFDAAARA